MISLRSVNSGTFRCCLVSVKPGFVYNVSLSIVSCLQDQRSQFNSIKTECSKEAVSVVLAKCLAKQLSSLPMPCPHTPSVGLSVQDSGATWRMTATVVPPGKLKKQTKLISFRNIHFKC